MRALFLVVLMLCNHALLAAKLDSLVVRNEKNTSSVLCMLTGSFAHTIFVLSNPDRVVIDFSQTSTTVNVGAVPHGTGLIGRMRSSTNPKYLRIVLDTKSAVNIKIAVWKPGKPGQNGVRIDLTPKLSHLSSRQNSGLTKIQEKRQDQTSIVRSKPARASEKLILNGKDETNKTSKVFHAPAKNSKHPAYVQRTPKKLRDVIVVIDPGHGGKDPGAAGPRHSAEKNVVLAIAQRLKTLIDKQPGMRAVMTRNGDYYVGLRERLTIARKYNADVFVSIHADAFINHNSNGASVFALSQRGATSEAARWLAEKENYSEIGGVKLAGLDDRSGVIRTVLLDLSQTATISSSLQMGTRVLLDLGKMTSLHNNVVEQARFVVLKSPDIPSILIETGFITNPREERNLTNAYYQARMTQAIFAGLKRYFWDYPPHGTRLEAISGAINVHVVRAGESLPVIADRYHVTVAALKTENHLSSGSLKPGEKLSIPAPWA